MTDIKLALNLDYIPFNPDERWKVIGEEIKDGRKVDLWVLHESGEGYRVADCYWHKPQEMWKTNNHNGSGYNRLKNVNPVMYILRAEPPSGFEHQSVGYRKDNRTYFNKR
jgi:hypothetical protein